MNSVQMKKYRIDAASLSIFAGIVALGCGSSPDSGPSASGGNTSQAGSPATQAGASNAGSSGAAIGGA
ncbi:MAG: hypothetical protein ABIQ16_08690, partial [Polyangiaceae bacterium]